MKYNKTFREALNEVRKIKEDNHTDVASAVRQSKTSIDNVDEVTTYESMLYKLVDEQTCYRCKQP